MDMKNYILKALQNYQGDNLERAELAFKNLSEKDLDREYDQSGETCREIWEGYKEERVLSEKAIKFVKSLNFDSLTTEQTKEWVGKTTTANDITT